MVPVAESYLEHIGRAHVNLGNDDEDGHIQREREAEVLCRGGTPKFYTQSSRHQRRDLPCLAIPSSAVPLVMPMTPLLALICYGSSSMSGSPFQRPISLSGRDSRWAYEGRAP